MKVGIPVLQTRQIPVLQIYLETSTNMNVLIEPENVVHFWLNIQVAKSLNT